MVSSIVMGATGILGREIVHELAQHPDEFGHIHALSRSKREEYPKNVTHGHIDLTASPEEMARDLKGVSGRYIFFAAYLQGSNEQENWDINGDMLQNFLSALEKNRVVKDIERITLVTGAKQYGLHLGTPKNPMRESDPWVQGEGYPPNFYYRQQEILHDFCRKHNQISWVVTYPNDVIGYAEGNFMNLVTALGLYAAVERELGHELVFPGAEIFYTKFDCFTSSKQHAQFCRWAALEPHAANQSFNVVDGEVASWQELWPRVADRFGLRVKSDQFADEAPLASEAQVSEKPPLAIWQDKLGLSGRIKPSMTRQRVDLVKWSRQDKVQKAWDRLADREGLQKDAFEKATWAFLGFVLGRDYDIVMSMDKARRLGWKGYANSWDEMCKTFDKLQHQKIIPGP